MSHTPSVCGRHGATELRLEVAAKRSDEPFQTVRPCSLAIILGYCKSDQEKLPSKKLDAATSISTNIPALLHGPRDRLTSHCPAMPFTNCAAHLLPLGVAPRCATSLITNYCTVLVTALRMASILTRYYTGMVYTGIYRCVCVCVCVTLTHADWNLERYIEEYQRGKNIGRTKVRHVTPIPLFAENIDMR